MVESESEYPLDELAGTSPNAFPEDLESPSTLPVDETVEFSTTKTIEEGIKSQEKEEVGAAVPIQEQGRTGATDQELKKQIAHEFGINEESALSGGQTLLDDARRILEIPHPKEEEKTATQEQIAKASLLLDDLYDKYMKHGLIRKKPIMDDLAKLVKLVTADEIADQIAIHGEPKDIKDIDNKWEWTARRTRGGTYGNIRDILSFGEGGRKKLGDITGIEAVRPSGSSRIEYEYAEDHPRVKSFDTRSAIKKALGKHYTGIKASLVGNRTTRGTLTKAQVAAIGKTGWSTEQIKRMLRNPAKGLEEKEVQLKMAERERKAQSMGGYKEGDRVRVIPTNDLGTIVDPGYMDGNVRMKLDDTALVVGHSVKNIELLPVQEKKKAPRTSARETVITTEGEPDFDKVSKEIEAREKGKKPPEGLHSGEPPTGQTESTLPRREPPTSLAASRQPVKQIFDVKNIQHTSIAEGVKKGLITAEEAAIIEGIMQTFPEAWRDHFEPRISEQRLAPTEKQRIAAGVGKNEQAFVAGALIPEKIGRLKMDARHLAVLFEGHNVRTFIHEIGEFIYARALSHQDREVVAGAWKKAMGKDNHTGAMQYKNEWFSDQFEEWWIKEKPMPKELAHIFTRLLRAIRRMYLNIRGTITVHPNMANLFNDIVTNGREINERYFYSDREMFVNYVFGSEPSQQVIDRQGFSGNSKTWMSWDPSSQCPKQMAFVQFILKKAKEEHLATKDLIKVEMIARLYDQALAEGVPVPCSYCYVEMARRKALAYHEAGAPITGVNFAMAKQIYTHVPYADALLHWSKEKVAEMNKRGGLRMFSFSDYIREAHYDDVERLLDHAKQIGLSIKAITKNPHFVEDFADRDITINLSVDDLGFGYPVDQAIEASKKYPNVHIRALGKNVEHIRLLSKEGIVDVITPYHNDGDKDAPDGFQDMGHGAKGAKELTALMEEDPTLEQKLCCQAGGKCFDAKHVRQCAANCGTIAGNLTVPAKVEVEGEENPRIFSETYTSDIPEPQNRPEEERETAIKGDGSLMERIAERKLEYGEAKEQGALFSPEESGVSRPAHRRLRQPVSGKLEVVSEEVGRYRAGTTKVRSADDVADIGRNLTDDPQEQFAAILIDDNGIVHSVHRFSRGTLNASLAHPTFVIGQALNTKGVTGMWLIHNHPSGVTELSEEDRRLGERFRNVAHASGVAVQGIMAVSPKEYSAIEYGEFADLDTEPKGKMPKRAATEALPVVERKYAKQGVLSRKEIHNPHEMKAEITKLNIGKPGQRTVILYNTRNQIISIMDIDSFLPLRGDRQRKLLEEIERRNAAVISIYAPDIEFTVHEAKNIAQFGNAAGISVLDILDKRGSLKAAGMMEHTGNVFFSRPLDLANLSFDIRPPKGPLFSVEQVKQFLVGPLARWKNMGNVKVIKTAGELPARFMGYVQEGDTIFGAYDRVTDTTYIIADSISSARAAVVTLIHEAVGHRGVTAVLNDADTERIWTTDRERI